MSCGNHQAASCAACPQVLITHLFPPVCKNPGHLDFRATALPGAMETASGAMAVVCQVNFPRIAMQMLPLSQLYYIIYIIHIYTYLSKHLEGQLGPPLETKKCMGRKMSTFL